MEKNKLLGLLKKIWDESPERHPKKTKHAAWVRFCNKAGIFKEADMNKKCIENKVPDKYISP